MEITVEMASKTSREYSGRTKWGVHPKGSPKDFWVDIYVQDRPKPGQVFNLGAIKEEKSKDGAKIFREAEIIGPAMAPQGTITPTATSNGNARTVESQPAQPAPTGQPAPTNGKIKWADWALAANRAWNDGLISGMPPAECVAFVNTTLIAYSNGKLELPTEAGPVMRQPGDDDDAYKDPNQVAPWGN